MKILNNIELSLCLNSSILNGEFKMNSIKGWLLGQYSSAFISIICLDEEVGCPVIS